MSTVRPARSICSVKPVQCLVFVRHRSNVTNPRRHASSAAIPVSYAQTTSAPSEDKSTNALSHLPTSSLVRSILLGTFFSSPVLFRLGFPFLRLIATSKSRILNPDKNLLLRAIIRPLIYDQFCAGVNKDQVQSKIASTTAIGFSGVILGAGREVELHNPDQDATSMGEQSFVEFNPDIEEWRQRNVETLSMLGPGNFFSMKFTGAGSTITDCLLRGSPPPPQFSEALDELVTDAASRGVRVFIDAEQVAFQGTIDAWTIDLQRKYNINGKGLVYNTLQSYLKDSKSRLLHWLSLSRDEGWTLAVKLVRGAYIGGEVRSKIHDTKADTDANYNGIVRELITGTVPGFTPGTYPTPALFAAGHNPDSLEMAQNLIKESKSKGGVHVMPDFGQLQGMADELGGRLIRAKALEAEENAHGKEGASSCPGVYKYMVWGSVQDCMHYLVRRTTENQGASSRMTDASTSMTAELRRRITATLRPW